MSLVNDLLEDFHRRRVTPEDRPDNPLAGIEIAPHQARGEGADQIGLLPWLFGTAGATILGVAVLSHLVPEVSWLESVAQVNARPPATGLVSIEPKITPAIESSAVDPFGVEELYDVAVYPQDGYTRVHFRLTGEREYWLQGDPAHGEIEIVITGTRLANPFAPHAFEGSGLQLQETHNTSTGLHMLLSFEPATRVQSQVVHDEQGPVLVLDVITAKAHSYGEGVPVSPFEQQRDASPKIEAQAFGEIATGGWGEIRQTRERQQHRVPDAFRSLGRARALESAKRPSEAIAEYIRALALDPNLHPAREALVALLVEAKQFEAAQRHLSDGMARAPAHAAYVLLRAQVLVAMKQPDRAIAILESLPTPAERRSDALSLLAALYQQKGEHTRAETLFRSAVRLAPHEARLWMGLGISLEGQQRKIEALAVYKQAESLADFETGPRRWLRSRIRNLSSVE